MNTMPKSDKLSPHNFLIPYDLWEKVEEEVLESGKSQSEIVREALAAHYNMANYTAAKKLPSRFRYALEVFDILDVLTKGMKKERFSTVYLSWPDVMFIKFNRWSFAKNALQVFCKICRELKHPVQFEAVILEMNVAGTNKQRLSKEGFNLFFEVAVTNDIIQLLKERAKKMVQMGSIEDFEERLIQHPSDEIIKSPKDIARNYLKRAANKNSIVEDDMNLGGDDDDVGFDTTE